MAVIIPGAGGATREDAASGAKILGGSLRFNSGSSHYLSRTPTSAGNRKTWTWSGWVKRAATGYCAFFAAGDGTDSNRASIEFDSEQLRLVLGDGTYILTSTQVFRDFSAWHHFVISIDTTQSTAANRIRLYVNGSEITAFAASSYPVPNYDTFVNATNQHVVGARYRTSIDSHFSGYLTEINFVDGYAYDSSYFGFTDPLTNTWRPKKYTGEYGTNGFYLPFDDDNAKGTDRSGKGNNWTANNFTGTSTSPDVVPDSPSGISYSTVPTVGIGTTTGMTKPNNYATWNPLARNANTFANGNLEVTNSASTPAKFVSTIGARSGKWYMETIHQGNSNWPLGITADAIERDYLSTSDGNTSISFWCGPSATAVFINGSVQTFNGSSTTWALNDIVGLALDADNKTIALYKNGTQVGTQTFSYSSYGWNEAFFAGGNYINGNKYISNFGQRPFKYTPPTGFLPLCTANLPRPTIVRPDKFMDTLLWAGNNANPRTISGLNFSPDLVWLKDRTQATNHRLVDTLRGGNKTLKSNTADAETSSEIAGTISDFTSDGFTLAGTSTMEGVNLTGDSYVAWCWKAGGQIGVGRSFMIDNVGFATAGDAGMNTGTITPTGASVNTKSGFSIITYNGNLTTAGNSTVGHGLGITPAFWISKSRSSTGLDAGVWIVWHKDLSSNTFLRFSTATPQSSDGTLTQPTSSVFTTTWNSGFNVSGNTYVAYIWAEIPGFSKFGSYTGNGSADGPFVFCGFRPAWILIKQTNLGTENWWINDSSRSSTNPANSNLAPNSSGSEDGSTLLDMVSNGFKIRNTFTSHNASGGSYIFAAYAESPTQNLFGGQSTAR